MTVSTYFHESGAIEDGFIGSITGLSIVRSRAGHEQHHHHKHSELYASSIKLLSPAQLDAFASPETATALRALYSSPAWGFVAVSIPAGKCTVALAIVCAQPEAGYLYVPTRSTFRYTAAVTTGPDGACSSTDYVRWDTHIISVGTARRSDWAGGGKDPAAALDDMRHRFASGTYKVISPPKYDWAEVRADHCAPEELRQMFGGSLVLQSASSGLSGSGGSSAGSAGGPSPAQQFHAAAATTTAPPHPHTGPGSLMRSLSGSGSGAVGGTGIDEEGGDMAGHQGYIAAELMPSPVPGAVGRDSSHSAGGHGYRLSGSSSTAAVVGGGGDSRASTCTTAGSGGTGAGSASPLEGPPQRVKRGVSFKGSASTIDGSGSVGGGSAPASGDVTRTATTTSLTSTSQLLAGGVDATGTGAGTGVGEGGVKRIPGVSCLDVIRQKKVALGPDVDVLLMIDYGTGQTAAED